MTTIRIKGRFQFRRALPAKWTADNPVLLEGEPGIELNLDIPQQFKMKIGDGVHAWNDIAYATGPPVLPSGTIVMWSGVESQIPNGWLLCDGSNGTPDLSSQFIIQS